MTTTGFPLQVSFAHQLEKSNLGVIKVWNLEPQTKKKPKAGNREKKKKPRKKKKEKKERDFNINVNNVSVKGRVISFNERV